MRARARVCVCVCVCVCKLEYIYHHSPENVVTIHIGTNHDKLKLIQVGSVLHCKPNKTSETNPAAQLRVLHFMTPNIKEKAKIYNEDEFPTLCS